MSVSNADLNELDAIFEGMGGVDKIEDYTNSFSQLPDGNYIGEIEEIVSETSKNSGKPQIKMVIAIEDGKKEYKYMTLAGTDLKSTQSAIARAVSQLKKLGVDGVELRDFLKNMEKLVGTKVKLNIKTTVSKTTGKEFRNTDLELV